MAIREPMTIKAWPDLRIGKGEVAENLKIFWGKVGEFIWRPRFWFSFFGSKLQNVNIILLGAFPDAIDAFFDASIVYYSSKRYMCHQNFRKIP